MKIQCCKVRGYVIETETGNVWVSDRQGCITGDCTPDELNAAEAAPGEWIDCPRGTEPEGTRDPQVIIDALLAACHRAKLLFDNAHRYPLPRCHNHCYEFPCGAVVRDVHREVNAAIALAEPKEQDPPPRDGEPHAPWVAASG